MSMRRRMQARHLSEEMYLQYSVAGSTILQNLSEMSGFWERSDKCGAICEKITRMSLW